MVQELACGAASTVGTKSLEHARLTETMSMIGKRLAELKERKSVTLNQGPTEDFAGLICVGVALLVMSGVLDLMLSQQRAANAGEHNFEVLLFALPALLFFCLGVALWLNRPLLNIAFEEERFSLIRSPYFKQKTVQEIPFKDLISLRISKADSIAVGNSKQPTFAVRADTDDQSFMLFRNSKLSDVAALGNTLSEQLKIPLNLDPEFPPFGSPFWFQ